MRPDSSSTGEVHAEADSLRPGTGRSSIFYAGHDLVFALLLRDAVPNWPALEFAGYALSASHAHSCCSDLRPAVLVLENYLADGDGFVLCQRIRQAVPGIKIVFVADAAHDCFLYYLRKSDVDGIVWKTGTVREELRVTVDAALQGGRRFPREFQELSARLSSHPAAFFKLLTNGDISLLSWFGRDLTDEDIAAEMGTSAAAVRRRRYRVMDRLGLHRTADLARWSRECPGLMAVGGALL